MKKYLFTHNKVDYKRINKSAARAAYKNGKTIIVTPCNLYPFNFWGHSYNLNRKNRESFVLDETGVINDFNNLVGSFEYYNCVNAETGRYAAFYIEV